MMIAITPLDTLFFRDGRPFSMGDDTWADGIFPPLPFTIYGAMRSVYIAYKGDLRKFKNGGMKNSIGAEDEHGSFKIKGIFIQRGSDIFYPLPCDQAKDKDSKNNDSKNKAHAMQMETVESLFFTNAVTKNLIFPKNIENAKSVDGGFLDEITLGEYLNAEDNVYLYNYMCDFVLNEPKTGIKRSNDTHTTEEGYLYRVGMDRLAQLNPDRSINEVSILVDYEGLDDFPDNCMLRLGGEAKSAVVKRVDTFKTPELLPKSKARINKNKKFKLYFATPAIFKYGWLPGGMDSKTLIWEKNGCKLKLLTVVIGKPVMVGGWDLANNKPKPMRKAVPAGSVYYFEILEGDAENIASTFHYKNISDFGAQEGFGLSLAGVIS
ncbi:MAG: type III-B CRISPR module-associated protein Cmr3 [wastewater metagenome]|nr:type III-B CRISPR module-associated protein Cmr3 [Candidatus Loosdrechtia aerotolerans]